MFQKITETSSLYDRLEEKPVGEILAGINAEDHKVADVVATVIPQVTRLVEHLVPCMRQGGRLFYIGAGTSGRLGVLDASEIPPTYGVSGRVIALIAGGDAALRTSVESAEDAACRGWEELQPYGLTALDTVVGLTASGTTPYVVETLRRCREAGLFTASITCNPKAPVSQVADIPIEVITGPEYVTGSTRMKAGTAQKLLLNMISTAVMIKLNRVEGNRMVHMQLANRKLVDRGTRMIVESTGLPAEEAEALLLRQGSVSRALETLKKGPSFPK
ncbi:MAG: N-acetylmuramic acid 6-phosphate etherase [Porphyromonadaceae bacterium]|nr:N-acetylmuramic acid 6-phosphate etherase [Porphyromonadaceae bacterium]